MILVFCMLRLKPAFSLSSFTCIKRLFSYSLLDAISVVSSAYLKLLIFLFFLLISACVSSSPAFSKMCSAQKLNQQGDKCSSFFFFFSFPQFQTTCSSLSGSHWLFLDLDTGLSGGMQVVWYFHVFKNFLHFVVIHTVDFYHSQESRNSFFF